MEYPEGSDSPLVWSWAIEALATDPRVDLDLLCDLIDSTPNLAENLNEAAREMVALRNLEGLYGSDEVLNSGAPLSSDQEEIQFDPSESSSRVLKLIVDKASVSSLRKDGSNALKYVRNGASDKLVREVRAYVEKKKASLPKCALKELSDIVQKGIAPETDLKRARICVKTEEGIVDDQSCELPLEKKQRRDNNGSVPSIEQNTSPLISSNMQDCRTDVQNGKSLSGKELGLDNNGFIASTEQNLDPLIPSDMQDCPVDVQSGLSPPGKKLRHDSNGSGSSTEQNSAPLISSGIQDCPVGGQSAKSPLIASTEKNSDPLISSDINQPCPMSRYPAQPVGRLAWWPYDVLIEDERRNAENSSIHADSMELDVCIKCTKGGEVLICSMSSCPVVVHERCLGFTESVDGRDDFICPFCVCSSAKSEYAAAKEKMLLAREKLSFFVGGNPDHQSMGFTEVNENPQRIFKGKGVDQVDQVSTDKQHEGHLARDNVHSSPPKCLSEQGEGITGKSCQVEVERRFTIVNDSPLRQARDERKFKGKGVNEVDQDSIDKEHEGNLAPDNVHTSPPHCLSEGGEESIPAKSSQSEKRFIIVDANPPRQGNDERNFEGKGKGVDEVHQASTDEQHKGHLAADDIHTLHTSPPNCPSKEEEESIPAKNDERRFILVDAKSPSQGNVERAFEGKGVDQVHQASTDEQQKDHLAPDDVYTSPPHPSLKGGEDITGKNCQLEEEQMMPIEQFPCTGGHHGVRTQQELDSPSKTTSCASSGKLYGTRGTKNQTAKTSDKSLSPQSQRKLDDQMQGASSATDHDSDENFEEEICKAPTSKFPQKVKGVYSRRMRVPWTEEEVEILKEGMKRFGSNMSIIPWSTILEFGSTVFWKGRTGVDLKDKWRNMVKANPELRQV